MTNNNLMDIEESLSSKVNDSKILFDFEGKNISLSDYDAQTKIKIIPDLANEMEKIYDKENEGSLKNENCSNISFKNNSDNSNNCFMSIEIKMKEILRNENPKDKAFYDDSEINKGSLCQDELLKEQLMDDINDNDTKNNPKIINNNQFNKNFNSTKCSSEMEEKEEEENQEYNSPTNSKLNSPEANYDKESSKYKQNKTKKEIRKKIQTKIKMKKKKKIKNKVYYYTFNICLHKFW